MRPLQKILYVEDEADVRAVAKVALETVGGFTVYICNNAQEALDAVPAFEPDLILLDVLMPEMDGPETLQALRKIPAAAQVPVVFLTANPEEASTLTALGAVSVINKPFDPMAISDQIGDIWSQLHSN